MTRVVLVAAATAAVVALAVSYMETRDVVMVVSATAVIAIVAPWLRER